jgi:predicted secreted hydrolase
VAREVQRRLATALLALATLAACTPDSTTERSGADLARYLGGGDTAGYALATEPRAFDFPADHGPHPGFRNEWWYITGNLATETGRRFGFQVTFFRIALAPDTPPRPSHWATREVWMAHVAVSDAATGRHLAHQRFARGAAGLAGARAAPFAVWLEDWRLAGAPNFPWRLDVQTRDFTLSLTLDQTRPPLLQGERGLSRKGSEPGNASYYYSLTRLATTGTLGLDGEARRVTGLSWLDREWSTSALAEDQAGWDWFALQLADGRDLMFYRLRRKDGSTDPMSAGTLRRPDGDVTRLAREDVGLEPLRWWSDGEGRRYPVAWSLVLPGGEAYRVEAVLDDQLMDLTVTYWEGMVTVSEAASGREVGRGYLELAGY